MSDNSFNKKIRAAVTRKIPNILVLGGREVETDSVTLRRYCVKEQITMKREEFLARMELLCKKRIMDNFADIAIA